MRQRDELAEVKVTILKKISRNEKDSPALWGKLRA
jgi:hypothetical protein